MVASGWAATAVVATGVSDESGELGAVPTLVATWLTYKEADSAEYTAAHKGVSTNPFRIAAAHPHLLRRLAGRAPAGT